MSEREEKPDGTRWRVVCEPCGKRGRWFRQWTAVQQAADRHAASDEHHRKTQIWVEEEGE